MRIEASIEIAAPPDQVWPTATDPHLAMRWNDNIASVSSISPGPVAEGTRWQQVVRVMGTEQVMDAEVVECVPPLRGVVRMTGFGQPIVTTTVEPTDGGSLLSQVMEFTIPNGLSGVALKLGAPLIKDQLREALRRQKQHIEEVAPAGDQI